ncbi:alpha/beta fold hydrolase [Xenophilus arseniciresistens]|uniref:Alpha/beta fold hydrolase n=1 Tax=Xenophilus arseniciresistens TaxID=1283306 RepID=A0AAE3SZY8_9BURK|nr:alpha/beta fold hydrolase [Xenophilus arseniciresistens]MDA7417020.1 alpha/beta fold hydrolase [Xenophilus arseniciresistens]
MTARALRWLVVAALLWSGFWLLWAWQRGSTAVWLASAAPWFTLWLALGLEFAFAALSKRKEAERPGGWALLRAWWRACWGALVVFGWLQPFRARAWPDRLQPRPGRRGVVLIHGLACNRGFWAPWLRELTQDDRCFIALDLAPPWGPVERHVPALDAAVRQVHRATGLAPLLVCHSMGGLVARAWLATVADAQAHRVVTLGTPHAGTALARADLWGLARRMRLDEPTLCAQAQHLGPDCRARFTCWYSLCDNIVFPAANARLAGATNCHAHGRGHVELAFDPAVRRQTLALLAGPPCGECATHVDKSPLGDTGLDPLADQN